MLVLNILFGYEVTDKLHNQGQIHKDTPQPMEALDYRILWLFQGRMFHNVLHDNLG